MRRGGWVAALAAAVAVVAVLGGSASTGRAGSFGWNQLTPLQKRLASGELAYTLGPRPAVHKTRVAGRHTAAVPDTGGGDDDNDFELEPTAPPSGYGSPDQSGQGLAGSYYPSGNGSCGGSHGDNVKVNQNCLNLTDANLQGRGQAQNETSIAIDPTNSNHLVAGYNDYRRGDGMCGVSYSLDNGRTWNDSQPIPMNFTRGTSFDNSAREYWQAGGDPAVAWDTRGNAYYDCQTFNRGDSTSPNPDQSSGVYMFRSTGNAGASWNFTGRPVVEYNDVPGSGAALEDKPYMTVDDNVSSPYRDRVYVTWTEFAPDGSAYLWEEYSSDYGEHFSQRHLVSTTSSLCNQTYGVATSNGSCNENQYSDPFVGPDGTLYVAYNNFNNAVTGAENRNQILLVKSTDGGNTFSAPVKVGDYYDLPDCATYQNGADLGRACVPEKGSSNNSIFRATNYASGGVNPRNPRQVVVTYGSYINRHSNEANGCVPASFSPVTGQDLYTGVKTPGACNNDILVSVSNNSGASFTGTSVDPRVMPTVTTDRGQATTDQFWQWAAFTRDGKLAVSYYDRQYGSDEVTGWSDMSLSGSSDLANWNAHRVTSSSMPPPTGFSGLFFGDYSGLAASDQAHPLWMDTRDPDAFLCPGTGTTGTPPTACGATQTSSTGSFPVNDENVYTSNEGVPSH